MSRSRVRPSNAAPSRVRSGCGQSGGTRGGPCREGKASGRAAVLDGHGARAVGCEYDKLSLRL
jgi:hypothetical protein